MNRTRERWRIIIFESDTPAGKAFDVILLITILLSLLVISLESVSSVRARYGAELRLAEWCFTALFTVEYLARLWVVTNRFRYARSFYGIIDLVSVLPTYLGLVLAGSQYFLILRSLRLLRVFRVLKLTRFLSESQVLGQALRASRHKIMVFLLSVFTIVLISGTLLYLVEGEANGFDSIPKSVYWAIVTLTTVGYGDISPQTPLGQFLAACIMILGYGVIAVPTGIVTSEITRASGDSGRTCPSCGKGDHAPQAAYCQHCGLAL